MIDTQKCMIELDFHFFKDCTGRYAVHVEYNGKTIDNIAGFKTTADAKKYAEKEFGDVMHKVCRIAGYTVGRNLLFGNK